MDGRIIKGIAGFYYVYAEDGVLYECRAKGIFRKQNRKPLVGDLVTIECLDADPPAGNIVKIQPRANELVRPAVANIDQAVVIFAVKSPEPNYQLLDRFLIMMNRRGIPCLICMNKADLADEKELDRIRRKYAGSGCSFLFTSAHTGEGVRELRGRLADKTSAVAGPSGVGKSSLVNAVLGSEVMETGEVSRKIGRGKHTTRYTFLNVVDGHTFLLDTPGFSSLLLPDMEKEELRFCYPEFGPYEGGCRFQGCVHVSEPDCAVKRAVSEEKIARQRYESYVQLYEELKRNKRKAVR